MLRKEGHDVVAFSESEKGMKQVKDGGFDVLITDVLMPHVDGIEVIRSLCKSDPNLWIVAISGGAMCCRPRRH